MAVRPTHLVILVFFQIILEIGSGCTLPLNPGTDPLNIQSENLPFLDDQLQNIYAYNPIESCRTFPSFLSVNIPNIDNSFKSVLSYGEECAMKYRQFRKLQCFEVPQSIVPPNPCLFPTVIPPTVDLSFLVNELTMPPTSSGLRLPLSISSSVTASDLCQKVTDLTNSNPCFSTTPPTCFDTFNPEIIPYSALPLPFTSTSNLDLLRSLELLESLFSPILTEQFHVPVSDFIPRSVPAITTVIEPNINNVTPLVSPRSTFTLPLAVTSTTYDIKPSQLFDSLPSISNIPSYSNIPAMALNNYELFVPTPNTLPHPLLPLSINSNEGNADAHSIDYLNSALLYNANQFINPPLDSELPFYNCPIAPTSAQELPVLVSCRGYQGSTNLPSLGTKLTFPLYRNCHTLTPLPVCTNTLPSCACPLSNSLPVSDFNCCTLPPTLATTFPSIIDSKLANTYKVAEILDDTCTSSSNSLSFSTLPSDLSLVGVSNCLSSTPNIPLLQSNSLLLFDDLFNSISEPCCNSFKRSPNINEVPKPSNNSALDIGSMDINKTFATTPLINDPNNLDSKNYTKKLRELISLVEMLVDDNVDERIMNDVLLMLPR